MAILLSNAFANALLQHGGTAVADQLGGGSLVAYSGTPPAGPNEALAGNTVLASWSFATSSGWASPSGGVLNLDIPVPSVLAVANGTATFFRMLSSGSAALLQGTIAAGGGDWNLNSTLIATGDNVAITGTPTIAWTTS